MLLMLVACTEETAEVDDLVRQEQYVTVRMQVPGMKAVTTRAAGEDNITSIVALVFRNDMLISNTEVSALLPTTTTTGTFTIPKPKSGDVIHFLGNLPAGVKNSLPKKGGTQVEVLCGLTASDYNNLSYWGKVDYQGEDEIGELKLYRNMAMISIEQGTECSYPKDRLVISGLLNPNQLGMLVPYDDTQKAFNFNLDTYNYYTLPGNPDPIVDNGGATPEGNDGAGYGPSLYVLEHANQDDPATTNKDESLYVICKIDKYYYKVALIDGNKQPLKIIRNHKYTILVNDLEMGAATYAEALNDAPINLEVIVTKDVTFSPTDDQTINLSGGYLNVYMDTKGRRLTTLSIAAEGFSMAPQDGLIGPDNNVYTYSGGATTFRFTPTSVGNKTIHFYNGEGDYLNVPETTIKVAVQASILANADKTQLYYNGTTAQSVIVNVTVPAGVETLSIAADDYTVEKLTGNGTLNDNSYAMSGEQTATFKFTLKNNVAQSERKSYITFSDANSNASEEQVPIDLKPIPVVTFNYQNNQTINLNGGYLDVQMNGMPNDGSTVTLNFDAAGFTVSAQNNTQLTQNRNVWTYTGVATNFRFTPTAAGENKTITITGEGENLTVTRTPITVTVTEAAATGMSVTSAKPINLYNGETSTTLVLTKPTDVQNVNAVLSVENALRITTNATGSIWERSSSDYVFQNVQGKEEIPFTLTMRDGFNTPGDYTLTFSDFSNSSLSVTTTISIVNIPVLGYDYDSNQRLFMDGGDGNPTTLPITIIVPDGSKLTELNISADGFIIKQGDETLSDNGSCSYSGISTTLTFVPTSIGDKIIRFSGTNDNLIVDKEISVTVLPKMIPIWSGEEALTESDKFKLSYDLIKEYIGKTILVDFETYSGSYRKLGIKSVNNNLIEDTQLEPGKTMTREVFLDSSKVVENKDIIIYGNAVTVRRIYYIPPSQN